MIAIAKKLINPRTVGRLSIYRRVLNQLTENNTQRIFSRDLAELAGVSASQVRQDLMNVSSNGTPQNGYSVASLSRAVTRCLGTTGPTPTVLLGAGHLGQALLHYFLATRPHLQVKAVLEINNDLVGKYLHQVPVYHESTLEGNVRASQIKVAILAVPDDVAQEQANRLVAAGVCSLLNFTTVRLRVPADVYVENNDIQMSLERVAYYANEDSELNEGKA